jgi:hypothetical protein
MRKGRQGMNKPDNHFAGDIPNLTRALRAYTEELKRILETEQRMKDDSFCRLWDLMLERDRCNWMLFMAIADSIPDEEARKLYLGDLTEDFYRQHFQTSGKQLETESE